MLFRQAGVRQLRIAALQVSSLKMWSLACLQILNLGIRVERCSYILEEQDIKKSCDSFFELAHKWKQVRMYANGGRAPESYSIWNEFPGIEMEAKFVILIRPPH